MNYNELLRDEQILEIFGKIDQHHNNKYNHGKQHAANVINNMIQLTNLLKVEKQEQNYLCIAALLHDIGQLEGKEEHYVRSSNFANNYLKDKVTVEWNSKITQAILKHHEKEKIENLSLFEHLLLFADKMDFTKNRLDQTFIQENKVECIENHIKEIQFTIIDQVFHVIIITDSKINEFDFLKWNYYSKLVNRIREFSNKINRQYKIQFIKNEEVL